MVRNSWSVVATLSVVNWDGPSQDAPVDLAQKVAGQRRDDDKQALLILIEGQEVRFAGIFHDPCVLLRHNRQAVDKVA